ncbi:hypothetical protein PC129_g13835 [Phytophthora cactorum]|uniref:Uncharacterized protein n=1 Tax=Phytophthora cactorum TaxID=29920 RepID=A0A329SWM2_9STRA|nr:hypothetical protein Pcac1_g12123 [Phytophthora cactorum]KAG2812535.1 hypothetical protein PC111_g14769 [Phytophthora cactorum]KAG2846404.1 hypothetical protein PC112_g1490 [Phytophthora cactorum]KAG2864752.1 hypothetical protein PC113_g4314 [Phytophthora cactorum]KAG2905114.1 hypothetical protein PC115_g14741 [Phytophthora cactorum]
MGFSSLFYQPYGAPNGFEVSSHASRISSPAAAASPRPTATEDDPTDESDSRRLEVAFD